MKRTASFEAFAFLPQESGPYFADILYRKTGTKPQSRVYLSSCDKSGRIREFLNIEVPRFVRNFPPNGPRNLIRGIGDLGPCVIVAANSEAVAGVTVKQAAEKFFERVASKQIDSTDAFMCFVLRMAENEVELLRCASRLSLHLEGQISGYAENWLSGAGFTDTQLKIIRENAQSLAAIKENNIEGEVTQVVVVDRLGEFDLAEPYVRTEGRDFMVEILSNPSKNLHNSKGETILLGRPDFFSSRFNRLPFADNLGFRKHSAGILHMIAIYKNDGDADDRARFSRYGVHTVGKVQNGADVKDALTRWLKKREGMQRNRDGYYKIQPMQ